MTQAKYSFRDGIWFHFEIDGTQLTINGSAWSGRERIWVDDELVSDVRSFSVQTVHDVTIGERNLQVVLSVTKLFRGVYVATVREGSQIIREAKTAFLSEDVSKLKVVSFFVLFAVSGLVAGYATAMLLNG